MLSDNKKLTAYSAASREVRASRRARARERASAGNPWASGGAGRLPALEPRGGRAGRLVDARFGDAVKGGGGRSKCSEVKPPKPSPKN